MNAATITSPHIVRQAGASDWPILEEKWGQRPEEGVNLLVENEEGIIGHLLLKPCGCLAETAMFVHPDHRHQGIGRALIEAAIEEARSQRVSSLWTKVPINDLATQKALRAMGFHSVWENETYCQLVRRIQC